MGQAIYDFFASLGALVFIGFCFYLILYFGLVHKSEADKLLEIDWIKREFDIYRFNCPDLSYRKAKRLFFDSKQIKEYKKKLQKEFEEEKRKGVKSC